MGKHEEYWQSKRVGDLRTRCIRGGYDPRKEKFGDILPPLHLAVTHFMQDSFTAEKIIKGECEGYAYGRFGNETVEMLERCVALVEGGEAALACASGNAANYLLATHFCSAGDNIVLPPYLYGGTDHLIRHRLSFVNIKTRFVKNPADIAEWRKCINKKTQYLFVEMPTNPHGYMYDIQQIASLAHEFNIQLVVDSTVATPVLLEPLKYGADLVMHSLTKSIAGFSQSMGGAIVGAHNSIEHLRRSEHRDEGLLLAPFNAWLIRIGIMTLVERMEMQARSTRELLAYFKNHERIRTVWHPFCSDHPSHAVAMSLLHDAPPLLYFEVDGSEEQTRHVLDSLQFCKQAVHLGDSNTLVTHCYSTTHGKLSPEEKRQSGIVPNGIRVSVGREAIGEILDDFEQALKKI